MGGLISLLGGGALRAIWGEISALLGAWQERKKAEQDHAQEIERLKLQAEADAAQHARNLEAQRLQAELGIKTIGVQADAERDREAASIFDKAVELTGKPTGFGIIDAWNAAIRPLLATEMIVLISLYYHRQGGVLDERGWELAGGVLGIYIADRILFKRAK